jgi:hypothetical protein
MAGSVEHQRGGIFALCRLIERFAEAIEFDLLERCGWSLDDLGMAFSWHDLWVLVFRWQKTPGTATCDAVQGVEHWSVSDQLLASIFDLLQIGNWQRAGKKSAPKPKRLQRPWEKTRTRKLGSNPIPISKFSDWWESKAGSKRGKRSRTRNRVDPPGTEL